VGSIPTGGMSLWLEIVRAVPLAPDVASAIAQLARREHWTDDDDLVFAGEAGGYVDGSALRRRFKLALPAAALRPLRFHDLRHTHDREGRHQRATSAARPRLRVPPLDDLAGLRTPMESLL
jgi:integrase